MRWDRILYTLILIGLAVGFVFYPSRNSGFHLVIVAVGVGLLFGVRRLSTGRWSR